MRNILKSFFDRNHLCAWFFNLSFAKFRITDDNFCQKKESSTFDNNRFQFPLFPNHLISAGKIKRSWSTFSFTFPPYFWGPFPANENQRIGQMSSNMVNVQC